MTFVQVKGLQVQQKIKLSSLRDTLCMVMLCRDSVSDLKQLTMHSGNRVIVFLDAMEKTLIDMAMATHQIHAFINIRKQTREIARCIAAVRRDHCYYDDVISNYLQASYSDPLSQFDLNPEEKYILTLIAQEHTTQDIADKLFLSPKTIENKRYRMTRKLNLQGTNSLLKFAMTNKELLVAS